MAAEDEISELLNTYERSLNTSDAALAAQCYTSDGVFMPTTLPTARGAAFGAGLRADVRDDPAERRVHDR